MGPTSHGTVDQPILMIDYARNANCSLSSDDACKVYAHFDARGSVVKTSDAFGDEIDRYHYSPYGEPLDTDDLGVRMTAFPS